MNLESGTRPLERALRERFAVALLVAAGLSGCASSSGEPPAQPALEIPAASPAATSDPSAWTGRWSSAPCGLRPFERVLEITAEGTFQLEDRISPCPEDAVCVWSGIETLGGSWRARARGIRLDASGDVGRIAPPPPGVLAVTASGLQGDDGCPFVRVESEPVPGALDPAAAGTAEDAAAGTAEDAAAGTAEDAAAGTAEDAAAGTAGAADDGTQTAPRREATEGREIDERAD